MTGRRILGFLNRRGVDREETEAMIIKKFCAAAVTTAVFLTIPMAAMAQEGLDSKVEMVIPEKHLIRNEEGRIIGIDRTNESEGAEYHSVSLEQLMETEQWKEYQALGLTWDEKEDKLYFADMEVISIDDAYEKTTALQYIQEEWYEEGEEPRISVTAVRDSDYELQYFEFYRLNLNENLRRAAEYVDERLEETIMTAETDEAKEPEAVLEGEEEPDAASKTDTEEPSAIVSIIGGADGPTSIFLAGKLDGEE